jgi:4'-phosphopantetheinyl transferase
VQVYWFEQSGCDVLPGDCWFSGSERTRLDGLHVRKRRADWRLGRWTAKCAIAAYLHLPNDPEALSVVELRPAASGAPKAFVEGQPAPLALSLSHSRDVGLCAIASAGTDVGCDVEAIEPRSIAFLTDYFTDGEQALVARTPAARRDAVLTLLWSAKESVLKALECGLRSDTRSVTAVPEGSLEARCPDWHPILAVHRGVPFHGWWRESLGLIRTVIVGSPTCSAVAADHSGIRCLCQVLSARRIDHADTPLA